MPGPDWRNAADYEPLRNADVATLAGEFLRRNPDYQADRERLARLAAEEHLSRAERDRFALAWGVRFRRARLAHALDTAGTPQHRRRDSDTTSAHKQLAPRRRADTP